MNKKNPKNYYQDNRITSHFQWDHNNAHTTCQNIVKAMLRDIYYNYGNSNAQPRPEGTLYIQERIQHCQHNKYFHHITFPLVYHEHQIKDFLVQMIQKYRHSSLNPSKEDLDHIIEYLRESGDLYKQTLEEGMVYYWIHYKDYISFQRITTP